MSDTKDTTIRDLMIELTEAKAKLVHHNYIHGHSLLKKENIELRQQISMLKLKIAELQAKCVEAENKLIPRGYK